MKLLSTVLGFLLVVALVLPAHAQDDEEYYEARDLLEVSGYGGMMIPGGGLKDWNDSLGAKTAWQVGLEVGYFLTPDLVLGVGMTYAQSGIDSPVDIGQSHRLYLPSAYLKYYFWSESDLAPYVKGMFGLVAPKFSTPVTDANGTNLRFRELSYDPALMIGGGAGIFYYTSDYSGLFLEGTFQYGFTEDAKKTFRDNEYTFGESATLVDIHAGVRVFFGTDE